MQKSKNNLTKTVSNQFANRTKDKDYIDLTIIEQINMNELQEQMIMLFGKGIQKLTL